MQSKKRRQLENLGLDISRISLQHVFLMLVCMVMLQLQWHHFLLPIFPFFWSVEKSALLVADILLPYDIVFLDVVGSSKYGHKPNVSSSSKVSLSISASEEEE